MKIDDAIKEYFDEIDEAGGEAAVLRRAAEVNACWVEAVRAIFKKKAAADYILAHTNAVYILRDGDEKTLIVYTDEALVRSELDNNQEFLKLRLANAGEKITSFRILSSKGPMKDKHPFTISAAQETEDETVSSQPLSEEEKEEIATLAKVIEDPSVRSAFEAALAAETQKNKS